jgi:hypothetical protein
MLEDVRIAVAGLYVLLMSADAFMELSGRYAKINVAIKAFPYFEGNREIQACIWGIMNACFAYYSVDNLFYIFGVMYIAMGAAGMHAVKRLRRVLMPKPAEQGSAS